MNRRDLVTCSGFVLLGAPPRAAPAPLRGLEVLTHYDQPPFVTASGSGLSHELLAWLRREHGLPGELSLLPRLRLDRRIAEPDWRGFVPWVNPSWFGDPKHQRFVWSDPVLDDEDLVLLRPRLRLEYTGIESLRGLTLGGVRGHRYTDADPEVAAGRMRREDALTIEQTLRKLLLGRVDVAFLSRSGLHWWNKQLPALVGSVHIAARPRLKYQRHLMLSPILADSQRNALLSAVRTMTRNSAWLAVLQRYGLQPATVSAR